MVWCIHNNIPISNNKSNNGNCKVYYVIAAAKLAEYTNIGFQRKLYKNYNWFNIVLKNTW